MALFKRMPNEKCSKCGSKIEMSAFSKPHECYFNRNRDEEPENRSELHHRADLRAALIPKRGRSKQTTTSSTHGTATVGVLLPEIEPERNEVPVKRRKGKVESKDLRQESLHPETEPRYESPKDVRDMDHTKPYAHSYREEGKYGSYPSHDGFDDESNP